MLLPPINDSATKLTMLIEKDDNTGKVLSITFQGTSQLIQSIAQCFRFFEFYTTHEEGNGLSVKLQKNPADGSIKISANFREALEFIMQDSKFHFTQETLEKLWKELPRTPKEPDASPIASKSPTLFSCGGEVRRSPLPPQSPTPPPAIKAK